ncbi:MAG: hypothetical protein Q9166_007451 [cf. Caloplaca sp. 2 TL-2023]
MKEVMVDPTGRLALWTEALNAKYHGRGTPFGKKEFDKMYQGYDVRFPLVFPHPCTASIQKLGKASKAPEASPTESFIFANSLHNLQTTSDVPAWLFVPELLSAYPSAKLVLTTRPIHSWLLSMHKTAIPLTTSSTWLLLRYLDPLVSGALITFLVSAFTVFCNNEFINSSKMQERFEDHESFVKAIAKEQGRELLVHESKDGWDPLCKFLEKERPKGEYPRVNDSESFVLYFATMRREAMWRAFGIVASVGIVAAVGVVIWMRYQRR